MQKICFAVLLVLLCCSSKAIAQLSADFTADEIAGCNPLLVQFTDLSQGNPVSWSWTLGNVNAGINTGPNSSNQNPGRIYSGAGAYSVCLTVTDAAGNTDTECKLDYINVLSSPEANVQADIFEGCAPLPVTFTDASVPGDGAITSWVWDLNNSTTVPNDASVSTVYELAGLYSVTLIVTDENNCVDFVTLDDFVNVFEVPDATFTADITGSCDPPLNVNFSNALPNATTTSFQWDFGDGTTSTLPNPSHNYSNSGDYDVSLITLDDLTGCTDTMTIENYINLGNAVNFTYDPSFGCDEVTIQFTDMTAGTPFSWDWDFGDGIGTSSDQNPVYTYSQPGCYTVTLTATNEECTSTRVAEDCINVYISPTASFTMSENLACELPFTVSFDGMSNYAGTWDWDFGDGIGTSTQADPTYTFTTFGQHNVTLTVTSPDGCETNYSETVDLRQMDVGFTTDVFEGCAPLTVNFTDATVSVIPITDIQWNFMDGNTATGSNPTNTFTQVGVYPVELIITNQLGCTDTTQQDIYVGEPPEFTFSAEPTTACVDTAVAFTSNVIGTANDWYWDFGDGGEAYVPNPNHIYVDTGYFDVCLTVFYNGCPNTLCQEDFVYIYPPIAKFVYLQNCFNPYSVTMQNNSIAGDTWYWDFGVPGIDTDTSTLEVPTYVYDTSGVYTITLTVTNDSSGCMHTIDREIIIADPQALFTLEPDTSCTPMTVTLIDNSIDAVQWEWTSPDGVFIEDETLPQTAILYNTPGLYSNIQLTVTDENGCTDSLIYTDMILASEVISDYEVDVTAGCAPITSNFTDISTSSDGEIISWLWDFGDGDSSTVQNPSHEYLIPGTYDVTLTVTNIYGCTDVLVMDDLIQPTYPAAAFEAPQDLCTEQFATFDNMTTGVGLNYLWDFGDGNTSTLENPEHAYTDEGVYTVCLTATDVNSCMDSICIENYITVLDPVANFAADTTYASCPPLSVNFEQLSANGVDWLWDFGDGSGVVSGNAPNHIYTEPGVYDVCMITVSVSGCQDTLCFEEYIQLDGPTGSFTFEPNEGCAPLEVALYGEGVDVVKWIWDSGCGDIQINENASPTDTANFVYTEAGDCYPFVVIEDFAGCQRVITSDDPVSVDTLNIDFVQDVSELCESGNINYSVLVGTSDPNISFFWEFPGGTPATSTSANPVITYATTGTYDATLFVSTTQCMDSLTKPNTVLVASDPVADFSFTPNTSCHPASISFSNLSSSVDGAIVWWEWDFGNGDVSIEESPSYVYPNAGNYDISLSVTSEHGCTNTMTQSIEILETPVADAGVDQVLCLGESFQLNATGNGTYSWFPADSLSCTNCPAPIANPTVTTTYEVTVTAPNGCIDTDSVTIDVRPYNIPNITLSQDTVICEGGFTQLFVSSTTPNVTFEWDNIPGLSCYSNCFNPFATPTQTTMYYVTAVGEGGCNARDSVVVAILGESNNIAGPDQVICKGDSIQLSVAAGANAFWSPSIGLSCAYCPDPIVYPPYSVTYTVELTTGAGCTVTDTLRVEVVEEGDIDAGEDQYICVGEEIQLSGIGPQIGNVLWTPNATLDDSLGYDPIAVPEETTDYVMTYLEGICTMSDTVRINVLQEALIPDQQIEICAGDTLQVNASGIADSYSWTPANTVSDPTIPNPYVFPEETTTYEVTGLYNTCQPGTGEVLVTVHQPPPIATNIQATSFFEGTNVEMSVTALQPGVYTYQWYPDVNLSCDDCATTIAEPGDDITYYVDVVDEFGCKNTASIELRIQRECENEQVVIPNAFTPNNDGLNDILYVRGSTISELTIFRIYDRWGELVFESNSLGNGWDGTFKGKPAAPGVYVYYAEAPCLLDGSPLFMKGNVTLVR